MNKTFIDRPAFSFSEVLTLTQLGRGTVEGYIKRGIVQLAPVEQTGRGFHRKYTGRDVLKISAVSFLSKAGLAPEHIAWVVADEIATRTDPGTERVLETGRSTFAAVVDEYAKGGEADEFRGKSPFVFNTVSFSVRDGGITGIEFLGSLSTFEDPKRLVSSQRKWDAISYVVFDAPLFVARGFEILWAYIKGRENKAVK
jgi:hypothetical protein